MPYLQSWSTVHKGIQMNRPIERWQVCCPASMAKQSLAAITYAIEDARHDILELNEQNKRLRSLLMAAAYPRRGTEEESMTIQDFANLIQSIYSQDQLENGL